MKLLLDTANVDYIRSANELFPIDGVTTNPTILAKSKRNGMEVLKEIRAVIGSEKTLHAQVLSADAAGMVKEGEFIYNQLGENTFVKIPVTPEGYKAMQLLSAQGIGVTATAIFTPQQALMAAKAGANYTAPYVNRIDNILGDGVKATAEIVHLFGIYGFDCEVLAASFKNIEQVHKISLAGAHSATISEDVFTALTKHPLTDWSVDTFVKDWTAVYGEGKLMSDF